ncbi:MAG: transposase [Burkholderiales bacterium]|nr:transposase [Bacteroidia bacterium]
MENLIRIFTSKDLTARMDRMFLDAHLFEDLNQVRLYSDDFIDDNNLKRPHESLGDLSPVNYKVQKTVCEFF